MTTTPQSQPRVIAIDGPAGSGKSTIAKRLAKALGLEYLDTGAMYRAVTAGVLSKGLDLADDVAVAQVAKTMRLELDEDGSVRANGVDVTAEIRGQAVTGAVSKVASNPEVRSELVRRQREWARQRGGGVLEGRDIGTAVFPDAELKVYLTASPEVRAARRADQDSGGQGSAGQGSADQERNQSVEAIAADIARRDAMDSNRTHDPLRLADDAIEVDTSLMTIAEVVAVITERVENSSD